MRRLIWKPLGGIAPEQIEEETGIPAEELLHFYEGTHALSARERLAVMCEFGGWPRPVPPRPPSNVTHRLGQQAYLLLLLEAWIEEYEDEYGAPFGEAPRIEPD